MKQTSERATHVLNSLRKAVLDALNKKRMLGQYAILEQNGKPTKVPPEALPVKEQSVQGK